MIGITKKIGLGMVPLLLIGMAGGACGGGRAVRRAQTEDAELNRCLRFSAKKHYAEAVECLESFKSRYPGSDRAIEAELRIGDSYFRKKDYLLAIENYQQFIKLHPDHPRIDYAYYRTGLANLKATPNAIDRDQGRLGDAIEAFGTVWQSYGQSPYAKVAFSNYQKARAQAAEQNLYVARFYSRTGEYRATLPRLNEIIDQFSDLPIAAEAASLKIKSHLVLGEVTQAETTLAFLQEKFPDHSLTIKASEEIGKRITKNAASSGVSQ